SWTLVDNTGLQPVVGLIIPLAMPTYEYESIPSRKGEPVKRYEFRQGMNDAPLSRHAETGEPIRRVYSAFSVGGSSKGQGRGAGHVHAGPGCCCGHGGCMIN